MGRRAAGDFLQGRCLDGTDLPAEPGDRFYPLVDPASSIRLAPGEAVLWRGRANVAELLLTEQFDDFDVVWELPEPADVIVTSGRVAFVCERWSVGGGWTSHGSAPITTLALNTASKIRAAAERRGVVMTGHCRWEWPTTIQVLKVMPGRRATGRAKRTAIPAVRVAAKAFGSEGLSTLQLTGLDLATPAAADAVGNIILQALVSYRLGRLEALGLGEAETEALTRLAARSFTLAQSGKGEGLRLPGLLLIGFLSPAEYAGPDAQRITDKAEGCDGDQ